MAEFKQKNQSFSLWKNDYKKEGDKKPDYTGTAMVNDHKFDCAMWINEDKNGKRYLAGTFKETREKTNSIF